ncbi:protein of unknown function, might belong to Formate dehydrogenase subunit gamma [Moritella yayanosii]|uniref:Uncharacterized protein n=1 Tax=Moritella yayanosii TaxID=69539 RepID=A0A330LX61_9GAMM|nr:protein of unknown function, might belong to Formate dehydrogenase subunit gamma [Moritella yayanosii]
MVCSLSLVGIEASLEGMLTGDVDETWAKKTLKLSIKSSA